MNTKHLFLIFGVLLQILLTQHAHAAWLISPEEAALPEGTAMHSRGIFPGPKIEVASPSAAAPVKSPLHLQINFKARNGSNVDVNSVRVAYVKKTEVDLTQRMKGAISINGIDVKEADIPPGKHTISVTVKDSHGDERTVQYTFVVAQ
jgi:hypothetical protein